MTNYTVNTTKKHHSNVATPSNCKPFSRCNNPKTCKTCNKIYQYKLKKKMTNHIEESIINSFENKYFIRFKNDDINISLSEKNTKINNFLKEFIKMKRNDNFVINKKDEYVINKEITYTEGVGHHPHLHMILLSNNTFDKNNTQLLKLRKKYNISCHSKDIYKINNSYKDSIINLIGYINKFDENSIYFDYSKLTRHEKKNHKSNLFSKKKYNKSKSNIFINFIYSLSLNICISNSKLERTLYSKIIDTHRIKLREAKAIFKRNANKLHTKNYLRLLKSLRKKKNLLIHAKALALKRLAKRFKTILT